MGYAVETKYFKLIVILPRLDLNNTRIYNQKIKALVSTGQILQITEVMTKKFSRERKQLTVLALGIRNSPGSSTSAVDVVKLLRKRHLSSKRNELEKNKDFLD